MKSESSIQPRIKLILNSIALIFLLMIPVAAQEQAQKVSYQQLLERVKKSDQTVDFTALRMAYTETPDYSPYGDREEHKAMYEAFKAKDYAKTIKLAEKSLEKNYVDADTHFISYLAYKELKDEKKTAFHDFMVKGLLKSIIGGLDGKTTATAFKVIAVDEEYVLLRFMGMRVTGQGLVQEKEHAYDAMTVVDPETNQTMTFYFNIDKPFFWMSKSLGR